MPLMRRGPGLLRGAARVGVAAGVAGAVQHRQQQRWASQEQEQGAEQAAAAPPAPQGGEADYTAELEKLAKLRDEGVITPDDFEAKKKQLLGI